MIQAYLRSNTNYDMNGDTTLIPTACTLKAELNGTWSMDFEHPIDPEGRWKYIEEEGVISVDTFVGKAQLFRIDTVKKEDSGVSGTAYPIFFDSADDCFLLDTRPEKKTGQAALDAMTSGSKYSGKSNIKKTATAYFTRRNLMDAINGEDSPTFIERWGGEILYNNYQVIINSRVGGDYGVTIRYGKNLSGLSYETDMSEVVTRIVPVAYNGYTMSGSKPWVDSPLINKYAKVYTKEMKFENIKMAADASEGEEAVTICQTQAALDAALTAAANAQYDEGIDKPAVGIEADMIDISRTEQYKEFAALEDVGLGDTVTCYHKILGINTGARVTAIEWDCIMGKAAKVTIGEYGTTVLNVLKATAKTAISGVKSSVEKLQVKNLAINDDGTIDGNRIAGAMDAAKTYLHAMVEVAETQPVRAMLMEDLNPNSPTYGAMAIGSSGFLIASERTADGKDWEWTTFGTGAGFTADLINAGTLNADLITAGELNGNLIKAGTLSADKITTGELDGKLIKAGTLSASKITTGELNGELIKAGTLSADKITAGTMSADRISGGTLVLGGANNASGVLSLKNASGTEIIKMNASGITLSGGASLLSANGVCGNLQFVSDGGLIAPLGAFNYGGTIAKKSLRIGAFIPSNYVIQSATITLITGPGYWDDETAGTTTTGYARQIELGYSDQTGTQIWGTQSGEYTPGTADFISVPDDNLGGFKNKPDGTSSTNGKVITSGDLKDLFEVGKVMYFELKSAQPSATTVKTFYQYTGAGLAVLNIKGYTKN